MDKIPFYSFKTQNLLIEAEVFDAIKRVFRSEWYTLGSFLKKFENEFAEYCGCTYSIGTGNGYDALKIGLLALGIKPGDRVIVPAFTFIASITAILHVGAIPVLIDIDPDTYSLSVSKISTSDIHSARALMPVHIYGNPADMDTIMKFAHSNGLKVIEDFAQSTGGSFQGKKTGTIGDIGCSSFYPVKTLGALGDGGIIVTNHEEMAETCRKLRNYGSEKKYHFPLAGYNSRLDEIQAAILSVKLKYLDSWIQERESIARRYLNNLQNLDGIKLPYYLPGSQPAYHIFPILTEKRELLQEYLNKKGIETLIHYPIPPHLQAGLKPLGYKPGDFPVTESVASNEISLPIYPGLTMENVDYVSECLNSFSRENF